MKYREYRLPVVCTGRVSHFHLQGQASVRQERSVCCLLSGGGGWVKTQPSSILSNRKVSAVLLCLPSAPRCSPSQVNPSLPTEKLTTSRTIRSARICKDLLQTLHFKDGQTGAMSGQETSQPKLEIQVTKTTMCIQDLTALAVFSDGAHKRDVLVLWHRRYFCQ